MRLARSIELWPLERLKPYDRNARTHSQEQVAKIAASITEFGFNSPILVAQDDGIIAGHGRLAAARKLGLPEVPVIVLDHLTPAQRRAYVLADNRIAEDAGWDMALLAEEIGDLDAVEFDLDAIGFEKHELDALLADGLLSDESPAVQGAREAAEQVAARPAGSPANDNTPGAEPQAGLAENYSRKIAAPIYEPKGDKPGEAELFDRARTDALLAEIDAAKLPPAVDEFLRNAATRHTVFRFDRIAEYYAHASPEVQELMERSALVIIDFGKAVELGYARLTERMLSEAGEGEAAA